MARDTGKALRHKLAPHIPSRVAESSERQEPVDGPGAIAALRDAYFAALNGLDASVAKRRGAKEKLAYIVRRIEQYYENTTGTGL